MKVVWKGSGGEVYRKAVSDGEKEGSDRWTQGRGMKGWTEAEEG